MKKIKVGVLGATGAVGQRFVQMLQEHPWFEITALCASDRNAGKRYVDACRWNLRGEMPASVRDMILLECEPGPDCKIVFSALPSEIAGEVEEEFAAAGYIVCSNARNHRYDADVPLLIPEVNPEHIALVDVQRRKRGWQGYITTNPNCSTTHLVSALHPLHVRFGVTKLFVVTMQAVSGAGYPGVSSMDILDNVVPYISGEEEKMEQKEPQKLLGSFDGEGIRYADFVVSAHCKPRADAQRPPGSDQRGVRRTPDAGGDPGSLARLSPAGTAAWPAQRAAAGDSLRRPPGSAAAPPRPAGRQRARYGHRRGAACARTRSSTSSSWRWATTPFAARLAAVCSTPNCWSRGVMSDRGLKFWQIRCR
jgi:hypothetical protein